MKHSLYQAFKQFDFRNDRCYLSGSTDSLQMMRVLPESLMKLANYTGKEQIKLLNEQIVTFDAFYVPVHEQCYAEAVRPLDERIEKAFAEGYDAVLQLPEVDLFHWMAKLMYGIFYGEMASALRQKQLSGTGANMSQSLMSKFELIQFMLQGIYRPVEFEQFKPWSIAIVPLAKNDMHFAFRDELNTGSFSLKFKDFGIVASLQDNGYGLKYHHDLLSHIRNMPLTDEQFEELAARFFYSSYLLNRKPEYHIFEVDEVVYFDAMPLEGMQSRSIYDEWKNDIYVQVLTNFWEVFNISKFEIGKDPAAPQSFFNPPLLPQEVI
jgi:hypothetical protein